MLKHHSVLYINVQNHIQFQRNYFTFHSLTPQSFYLIPPLSYDPESESNQPLQTLQIPDVLAVLGIGIYIHGGLSNCLCGFYEPPCILIPPKCIIVVQCLKTKMNKQLNAPHQYEYYVGNRKTISAKYKMCIYIVHYALFMNASAQC